MHANFLIAQNARSLVGSRIVDLCFSALLRCLQPYTVLKEADDVWYESLL